MELLTFNNGSSDCRKRGAGTRFLLIALLLATPAQGVEGAAPGSLQDSNQAEPRAGAEEAETQSADDAVQADADPGEAGEDTELTADAMRDPLIGRLIRERRLIDKPRFSLETGGKIQVQYYDADPDDPDNEDEWVLRRFRPFLMGHFAESWRWKFELEISSEITALDFDTNDLDIRDAFIRYVGFEKEGRRLTLGNQKVPFSRDFMHPSTSQLFVERTFVGQTKAGVPDRTPGVHFRGTTLSERFVLWASAGMAAHKQDVNGIRFESLVGASSDLNIGWLAVGRLDLRPTGALQIGKEAHYDLSLAAYHWSNNGSRNTLTESGAPVDPEKADLDQASGLELSGRIVSGDFALFAQYNLIRAETVAGGFTGGIYVDGETDLESSAIQAGYRFFDRRVQLVGALTRLDSDGYTTPWKESILGINLKTETFLGKLQISHRWISDRFGLPDEDYQETRLQVQYLW